MNLEPLMGTEFDCDLYIAASLSREIYAYSIKIPAKFAKKFLACLQTRIERPESPIPGAAVFSKVVRFSAAFA
jgi:hypothetical protein